MKKGILLVFLLLGIYVFGQENEASIPSQKILATVVNAQTDFPLESVHVINLTQVIGTITNQEGKFSITAAVNDTLYFSYLGFKPEKVRVTNDMLRFEETRIALTELAYALEEVVS